MISVIRATWGSRFSYGPILILLLTGFVAVSLGIVISLSNPVLLLLFILPIVGIALIAMPLILLWAALVGGLILSGLAMLYAPQLQLIRWGAVVAAMCLVLISIFRLLTNKSHQHRLTISLTSPSLWLLVFFLVSAFSGVFNDGFGTDTVIGLKGYFQALGVALALAWFGMPTNVANRYIKFLLWLALLQVPFSIQQHLVLVPQRMTDEAAYKNIVASDVVAGTFGAWMDGGGASPIMAALQVTVIGFALALWRAGKIPGFLTFALTMILLVPIALSETKITFVLIFPILAIVFQDRILAYPFQTIVASMLVVIMMLGLMMVYIALPSAASQQHKDIYDLYESTLEYNVGARGYGDYVLNRTTVYSFWAKYHNIDNMSETLIGHGPGATNESGPGLASHTVARDKYPGVGIGLTGISALLWEIGLLGTITVIALYLSAFYQANILANHFATCTQQWALFKCAQSGLAALLISLAHNNYFVFDLGFQMLTMLLVGYVIHGTRNYDVIK